MRNKTCYLIEYISFIGLIINNTGHDLSKANYNTTNKNRQKTKTECYVWILNTGYQQAIYFTLDEVNTSRYNNSFFGAKFIM